MGFIRGRQIPNSRKIVPLYHQIGDPVWINEREIDGRLFAEEVKTGQTIELETITLEELLKCP